MAGSDQSVNLGGMLTNISDTIGGMSAAGEGYNNAFINAFKPQIDPSSPESLQAAAEWASNNGRTEEASAYRKEASVVGLRNTELETKEAQRVLSEKATATLQMAGDAANRGDLEALSKAEAQMNGLIQGAPLEAHKDIRDNAEAIRNMREQALGKKSSNEAKGAIKLSALLKDEEFREKAGDNLPVLEGQLERLLEDPKTLEAFNAQVEQQAVRSTAELEAKTQAETQQAEANIQKLVAAGNLEEAIAEGAQSKYPELVKPYVELAKSRLELQKAQMDTPGSNYDFRLGDVREAVKNLKRFDGSGFESGAQQYEDAIARIETDKNMSKDMKASELAKLREKIFQQDKELSKTAFGSAQTSESEKRTLEIKAASSRPTSTELSAFRSQQNEENNWFERKFGKSMSDQDFANAYSDVQRHNFGLPTAHYEVKDGKIVFKDGQPVSVDRKANGYRKASEIGLDVSSAVNLNKRGVPQAVYDRLSPEAKLGAYVI